MRKDPKERKKYSREYYLLNKARHAKVGKAWAERNRERIKKNTRRWRLKQFGLTEERFYQLRHTQGNKCAICEKVFTEELGRDCVVDHNHQTGKVRGLLCRICNVGLGGLGDSIELLGKAQEYLKRNADTKS